MIKLNPISGNDPALANSKLLDALYKTLSYAEEHNGIGLTATKSFNRKFCHWAADNFAWPEYKPEKLLRFQKVLNEDDVLPVMVLHDVLSSMKLGRHVKGKFQFSQKTKAHTQDRGRVFIELAENYLFRFNHGNLRRHDFAAPGNWDVWLNVINVEANQGTTDADLLQNFYGFAPEDHHDREYWHYSGFLMWEVLKPLSWIGFLNETEVKGDEPLGRRIYTKTELWRKCLRLDTDQDLRPQLVH
tara:strand:+ start:683 stop:1414 length:732 start_codon:yes stop_codon:yes gene_type:complete